MNLLRSSPLFRYSRVRRYLIRSRWRIWLAPFVCALPYLGSVGWLFIFSQKWIAFVMLIPFFMIILIASLTFILARIEFKGRIL